MSHTLKLRVPDPVLQQLQACAAEADQTPTRTALQLLTHALANATRKGRLPAPSLDPPSAPAVASMPSPSAGGEMPEATWQAILALHARYPRQLERLKDGWWEDNSHAETLTALASWRAELDATPDHRQELSYQHQLHSYASQLRSEPGGTASLWKPQVE